MGRPRTPIGTFGEISFTKAPKGQVLARTRYRDDDGRVRLGERCDPDRGRSECCRSRSSCGYFLGAGHESTLPWVHTLHQTRGGSHCRNSRASPW